MSPIELRRLFQLLNDLQNGNGFCPVFSEIFRAFRYFDPEETKVLILGQDPYHGVGQADGLAFSVPSDFKPLPPSLRNIFKELSADTKSEMRKNGNLEGWAEQGILLLNSILTVNLHEAGSHQKQGWQHLTRAAIEAVNELSTSAVFVLWGKWALATSEKIDAKKHLILPSAHPSPLSAYRGFFGSRPFSKANEWLLVRGKEPINW